MCLLVGSWCLCCASSVVQWGVSNSFTCSSLITTKKIDIMKSFGISSKVRKVLWQCCVLPVCNSKWHLLLHYLDGFTNFGCGLQFEKHVKFVVVVGDINILHLNRITLMPTVDYLNVLHLWYIFERLKAYICIYIHTCNSDLIVHSSVLGYDTTFNSCQVAVYYQTEHNIPEDLNL